MPYNVGDRWTGETIRRYRRDRDPRMRLEALGKATGIDPTLLSRYENGRRPITPDNFDKILVALGVTRDAFMSKRRRLKQKGGETKNGRDESEGDRRAALANA